VGEKKKKKGPSPFFLVPREKTKKRKKSAHQATEVEKGEKKKKSAGHLFFSLTSALETFVKRKRRKGRQLFAYMSPGAKHVPRAGEAKCLIILRGTEMKEGKGGKREPPLFLGIRPPRIASRGIAKGESPAPLQQGHKGGKRKKKTCPISN